MPLAGAPLVTHAVRGALACRDVGHVAVVAPEGHLGEVVAALSGAWSDPVAARVDVVAGGADRSGSVAAGLAAMPRDVGIVLVHDAARALTPPEVFSRVVAAVRQGHPAVVPALPVTDTVKVVHGDTVVRTLDRAGLRAVQTPQGFLRETLEHAHDTQPAGTDDAGMVEAMGAQVSVVDGDRRALKITTPQDLRAAEQWLADERRPTLVVLGGLPGVGKTTAARGWAQGGRAAHLRLDTVEQALLRAGAAELGVHGYAVLYAVADDLLGAGCDVVADTVNPVPETRTAWRDLAARTGARVVEVELVCSDRVEHDRRVTRRVADIAGHRLPTVRDVREREYRPWAGVRVLDTAGRTPEEVVRAVASIVEEETR